MRTTDILFSAVYLSVMLIGFTQIGNLTEFSASGITSAKFYPQLVLGLGLLTGVIETGRTLMSNIYAEQPDFASTWRGAFRPRRMVLLALFIVYLLSMKPLGFMVSTAAFCFVTTVLLAPVRNPKLALVAGLVTLGTLALIYLLLVVYLQAFLP